MITLANALLEYGSTVLLYTTIPIACQTSYSTALKDFSHLCHRLLQAERSSGKQLNGSGSLEAERSHVTLYHEDVGRGV